MKKRASPDRQKLLGELPIYAMLLPGVLVVLVYAYGPMVGNVIAFEKFLPGRGLFGSQFVGWTNFAYMFRMSDFWQVIYNTVFIAAMKIALGILVPVVVALLLNEVGGRFVRRGIQTVIYLPYFLSWVILSGIFITILSPSEGILNQLLGQLGVQPVFFLGDEKVFPYTLVLTDTWKNFGYGTIVYLAALTGINPNLYEAARVDGANRLQQTRYITLPGISTTVVLLSVLSLGNILNAGFEQVLNLYSPAVYRTGDILDTLIYRLGTQEYQYGVATAVGLMKSLVAFVLIASSNVLARRFANYRIF